MIARVRVEENFLCFRTSIPPLSTTLRLISRFTMSVTHDKKRIKLNDIGKYNALGVVADLMDDWTRLENQAYDTMLREKREIIANQARVIARMHMHMQRLEEQKSAYISRINAAVSIIHHDVANVQVIIDDNGVPDFLYDDIIDLTADEELSDTETEDLLDEVVRDMMR